MSRRVFALVLILMIGLLSFGIAAAQDATQEPTPTNEIGLGDVVGNKAQYYGQQVTVEGTIEEVINVRAFVLGDQATLNDHRVLVINNSPQDFDIGVRKDQKVRVIGNLCPSFNEGGWTQLVGSNSVNGPSPTQQVSANATQQAGATGNQTGGNTAGNMAGCGANGTAGNTSFASGTSGNTTGSNSSGSSTGSTGNSTGNNSSGTGSNTTGSNGASGNTTGSTGNSTGNNSSGMGSDTNGSNGSTSALGASGVADQSSTNPNSLQNQNPGTPGTAESSSTAATAGGSGATAPNTSGAAATQQAAPTLMPTEQMTAGQSMAQQMTNGNFDLSQMYIRPDLRDFTVLVLNELHITYIPS